MKKLLMVIATLVMVASFMPKAEAGDTAVLNLNVGFDLTPEPIISIELVGGDWILEGVKLGELRENRTPETSLPIHKIVNRGNVTVSLDIGYFFYSPEIKPGFEQGLDTFITKVEVGEVGIVAPVIIPPDRRLDLGVPIDPGMEVPLPLTYGAPTALSAPYAGMSASYDIRAYGAVGPIPVPVF